jgi:hypothetical protein
MPARGRWKPPPSLWIALALATSYLGSSTTTPPPQLPTPAATAYFLLMAAPHFALSMLAFAFLASLFPAFVRAARTVFPHAVEAIIRWLGKWRQ